MLMLRHGPSTKWDHTVALRQGTSTKWDHTNSLVVLAFRCQHSLVPSYLSDERRRASDVDSRRRLRSASTAVWSFRGQRTARSVTALSPSLRRKYGTLCRLMSHLHPHYRHLKGYWKLSFSTAVMHPTVPIYSRYCLAMHENYWCYVTLQLFASGDVNCRSFLLTCLLNYTVVLKQGTSIKWDHTIATHFTNP